jgi:hypothetical protein
MSATLLETVTKIAKRPLDRDEVYLISRFETKIRKTDEFIADLESGKLLKQGEIPGSYNGHICSKCSHNRAKWDCNKCGKYYCQDHIEEDLCDDCSPHCMACCEKKFELKFCSTCEYDICEKCDPVFWEDGKVICSDCIDTSTE